MHNKRKKGGPNDKPGEKPPPNLPERVFVSCADTGKKRPKPPPDEKRGPTAATLGTSLDLDKSRHVKGKKNPSASVGHWLSGKATTAQKKEPLDLRPKGAGLGRKVGGGPGERGGKRPERRRGGRELALGEPYHYTLRLPQCFKRRKAGWGGKREENVFEKEYLFYASASLFGGGEKKKKYNRKKTPRLWKVTPHGEKKKGNCEGRRKGGKKKRGAIFEKSPPDLGVEGPKKNSGCPR